MGGRRRVACLLAAILLSSLPAGACGDKLLTIGRGLRLPARPAAILGYASPGSRSSALVSDPAFHSLLRKAGHTVRIVADEEGLRAALRRETYDLVLADAGDAPYIGELVREAGNKPVLVPIVYQKTRSEIRAVARQYQCVLEAPGRSGNYLSAIEKAMELKAKRSPGRVQPVG